jgi:hypothetical protein
LHRTRWRTCKPAAVSLPVPLRHYHRSPLLIINFYHIPSRLPSCFISFVITTRTIACKYTLRLFSC